MYTDAGERFCNRDKNASQVHIATFKMHIRQLHVRGTRLKMLNYSLRGELTTSKLMLAELQYNSQV